MLNFKIKGREPEKITEFELVDYPAHIAVNVKTGNTVNGVLGISKATGKITLYSGIEKVHGLALDENKQVVIG